MATTLDQRNILKLDLAVDVLRSVGEARLAVSGGSMMPSLWPGDILEVHRVAVTDVSKGDIVVFVRDNRLIVHRVLRINREHNEITVTTRGDRSARVDSPVSVNELLGKVHAIQRGGRSLAPHATLSMQMASWILRRSEFLTRLLLHFSLVRRNVLSPERAWAS